MPTEPIIAEETITEELIPLDYSDMLTDILLSNDAILNRLELLILIMLFLATLYIFNTLRRKKDV